MSYPFDSITNRTRILEIVAVVLTGLGKLVFVNYLNLKFWYIVAACLLWVGYVVFRSVKQPGILNYWGFTNNNFKRSISFLAPLALISIISFFLYGYTQNSTILNWHILPVLIVYPIWGTIQQFLMVGLVAGNMSDLKGKNIPLVIIIIVTSITFSIVHVPSLLLVLATLLLAIVYTLHYLKARNLWTLGLFHGWLGGLFYFIVLGRDPWVEVFSGI